MEKKRDLNLDLIRAAACLLVVLLHTLFRVGFTAESLNSPAGWFQSSYWLLTKTCVPLFLLLSGWLNRDRQAKADYYINYLHLYIPYLLVSAFSLTHYALFLKIPVDLHYALGAILNFYACNNTWYLMMYTGLYLMIPFLNILYRGLETRGQKRLLLLSFFALSVLPSLVNGRFHIYALWWTRLYPILFYFLGSYLREYPPRRRCRVYVLWLLCALLLFALRNMLCFRGDLERLAEVDYDHYEILALSLLIFCVLKTLPAERLPEPAVRAVRLLAKSSFYVFLLSGISDDYADAFLQAHAASYHARFVWAPVTGLLSCALSVAAAMLLQPVGDFCAAKLMGWLRARAAGRNAGS